MVKIRMEIPSDAGAIEAVTVVAFRDAAHSCHTEQFIVGALRAAGQLAVSLVLPDVPPEYFQAVAFNAPLPRGTVAYHAAFAAEA